MFYIYKRIQTYLLAICLSIFCIQFATAQKHETAIKGTIFSNNQTPAEGVTITLKGKNKTTVTNNNGYYELSNLNRETYTLIVSLVGSEDHQQQVVVEKNKIVTVDITLSLSNTELNQVVILSNKSAFKTNRVSSSLRLNSPINEIPQNIQVITGKLINDQQIFNMLEGVTRNVSGATRVEHWDNYANITMRGSQVAAFRNGMNISSTWGPLTEDMSMVERIEFVKGPAGFMLANGNPSGFYNVVTKKPSGRNKGEASLTYGSFDMYRATLDLDGKLTKDGKLLYRFNAMAEKRKVTVILTLMTDTQLHRY